MPRPALPKFDSPWFQVLKVNGKACETKQRVALLIEIGSALCALPFFEDPGAFLGDSMSDQIRHDLTLYRFQRTR